MKFPRIYPQVKRHSSEDKNLNDLSTIKIYPVSSVKLKHIVYKLQKRGETQDTQQQFTVKVATEDENQKSRNHTQQIN